MKLSAELSNRDHKGGEMMQKKTYCALDIAKFMSAFLVFCIGSDYRQNCRTFVFHNFRLFIFCETG